MQMRKEFFYERLLSTQEENKNEVRDEINKLEEKRNINDTVNFNAISHLKHIIRTSVRIKLSVSAIIII